MFRSLLLCWATFALTLLLSISLVAVSSITIFVSQNGSANSSCLLDQGTCSNLTDVIEFARNKSYFTINLLPAPGGYTLESTRVAFFHSQNITISGLAEEPVAITCSVAGVGISFVSSTYISLCNIVMTGCGMEHVSTTKDFFQQRESHLSKVQCHSVLSTVR